MNPTVTIHSDAAGVTRTITLTKTGADMGHITMSSTAAFRGHRLSVLAFV